MKTKYRRTASWTIALAAILFTAPIQGEEFRNGEGRFKLEIPKNWMRLDAAKKEEVRRGMAGQPKAILHEGFEPRNADPGTVIIVIEDRNFTGFATYDLIDAALQKELANQAGMNVRQIKLDRAKNRFIGDFDTNDGGINTKGKIYGFLGKNGIVMIMGMAPDRQFANHQPTFDAMADSFQFDPGFQFVPIDPAVVGGVVIGVIASLCCGVVLVIGVIVVIIILVTRKR